MKFNLTSQKMTQLALALFAAYAALLLPMDAMAVSVSIGSGGGGGGSGGTPEALAEVLCNVVGWFTGPVGAGIATLAIIVIGIGALMGKVSWGMAIIVGLGVGVIFGAGTIVEVLSSNSTTCY
ncbi:MAG: TrbC/VirB2 family protein [Alphaproteobacteria bacterium]|nr:TrbC/VirB2 family protein [Alphaproteobacteria bacterium]